MFLIRQINHHNPARVPWQPGGISSLTTPNFAQAPPKWAGRIWGRKGRIWPGSSPSAPGSLLAWGSWAGGWSSSSSWIVPVAGILCYSPNSYSCPSSQQQHPEHRPAVAVSRMPRGRPGLCRSLCSVSGIQQGKTSQRGEQTHFKQRFLFPSQDVRDAAGLFHHSTCMSPAAHTASPLGEDRTRTSPRWRQNQDIPSLAHRAAKPQTPHFTLFIALVKRNTWRD